MASYPKNRNRFENVLHIFPQGHEKPLKNAFYNAAAMALFILCAAGVGVVYFIMGPFVRPLFWAVLCGSVLHPFKRKLTSVVRKWLNNLKSTGTPLTIGLIAFPIAVIDQTAEKLGGLLVYYAKPLFTVTVTLFSCSVICVLTPGWLVWVLIACHALLVIFYWTPQTSSVTRQLAIPLWIAIFLHIVAITGPLRIPVFIFFIILMAIGFVKEFSKSQVQKPKDDDKRAESTTFVQNTMSKLNKAIDKCSDFCSGNTSNTNDPTHAETEEKLQSNVYIWSLVWAYVLIQFYYHMWLLPLFACPIWYFAIKHSGEYIGLWSWIRDQFLKAKSIFVERFNERKDAIIPVPVRGLVGLASKGDEKIINIVDSSIDTVVSLGILVIVLFFALLATIFFLFQIHAESMHMVQITSNVINKTVVNNPQLQALLPDDLKEMADSMIDKVYMYSREKSATMVRDFIGEADPQKAILIEKQVHELVDKLYRVIDLEIDLYNQTHIVEISDEQIMDIENQSAHGEEIGHSWNKLVEGLSTPGLFDFTKMSGFFKENIGTFLSVLEGVWNVAKGNVSLVMNALTALLSLVFSGGTAILNFFVNSVVFITSLFYLLATSKHQYKVAELIGQITPTGAGTRFGSAVESAINDVFTASFKMALFYGMWTWLGHTLMGVKIVYLPSAVAAILGAVPLLGTYWAAIPAILELWLIQDNGIKAAIMFAWQALPMSFVDNAIYSEIKGGGPYLTGLAIGGGIVCLGAEGAIIGPIILCCLFFAVNMISSITDESSTREQTLQPKSRFRSTFNRSSSVLNY